MVPHQQGQLGTVCGDGSTGGQSGFQVQLRAQLVTLPCQNGGASSGSADHGGGAQNVGLVLLNGGILCHGFDGHTTVRHLELQGVVLDIHIQRFIGGNRPLVKCNGIALAGVGHGHVSFFGHFGDQLALVVLLSLDFFVTILNGNISILDGQGVELGCRGQFGGLFGNNDLSAISTNLGTICVLQGNVKIKLADFFVGHIQGCFDITASGSQFHHLSQLLNSVFFLGQFLAVQFYLFNFITVGQSNTAIENLVHISTGGNGNVHINGSIDQVVALGSGCSHRCGNGGKLPLCIISFTSFSSGHCITVKLGILIPALEGVISLFRNSQLTFFKSSILCESTAVGNSEYRTCESLGTFNSALLR